MDSSSSKQQLQGNNAEKIHSHLVVCSFAGNGISE